MIRRITLLTAAFLVLQSFLVVPAFAGGGENGEKVKAEITKLGTGPDAHVKVRLKDGRKVEGFVAQAGDSDFVVENPKTGERTPVAYPAAKQVKGNNFSTGVKILIGVGVAIAFIVFAATQLK